MVLHKSNAIYYTLISLATDMIVPYPSTFEFCFLTGVNLKADGY
jgi:hypothetical protein